MTFDEILEQVIALLKRQGRVSYGALKRRFDLDDAYLEDLKGEILYVHEAEVEADERGFTWTGETEERQGTTRPPAQTSAQPPIQPEQPPQAELPPTAPHTPEAERRQLTVMFCDLVDSTKLSSHLDPEEYREVVRAYQATCTEVIRRYDGHIAQLLGDGLLVYFGYPVAHEDDAQRAARTGLGILDAMGDLRQRLEQDKGIQLAIRIGVHTGLVVVGEMGGTGRQEQLALGEVPNIASRIEGLAAPNTVVMSAATYRLVQGYFECQDLGAQTLRGVAEPLHVYRVFQESGARGRLDVAAPRGLTPLVGRESEVTLLQERWVQAKSGQGQVILLTGEAGIGKSRLVQMLKEHVVHEPHTRWECRSAEYSQNTALFPHTDLFQRLLQFQSEETPDAKVRKLEQMLSQHRLPLAESVPLFAPLLSLPIPEDRYPALHVSPQRQRQKTLETMVAILLEHAERHPVLFILEDLHWADPTTLEWLHLVIEQIPTTSVCMILTCRPTFQPSWSHRSYLSEITVSRLSHAQVEQIVTGMTDGKTLPPEVLAQIVERTDGVPLFVEELTKAVVESGSLKAVHGHYALTGAFSTLAIPATLQDSLMARLDRLVTAKAVAQYAAVIGRHFAYDLLHTVSQLDEATLQRELDRLVDAELVYQRGLPPQSTYVFKHALIQEAAYQSLLKSTRQQYHQRIAQVLEAQFPETVETQPELLAHHYTEAGLSASAVAHWQRAGERAFQRSANFEAVSHVTKGLEVLTTLPETRERTHQELAFQLTLGTALAATKSQQAPETARTYARACELARQVGDTPQRFQALWGFWYAQMAQGQWQRARELGEEFLGLAQQRQDPLLLVEGHRMLGNTVWWQGELAQAYTHVKAALALYDPEQHRAQAVRYGQDSGVVCGLLEAWILWMLGYPDQALRSKEETLVLARRQAHPLTLALALLWSAMLHQLRREPQATQAQAEEARALCTEQGFLWYGAWGLMPHGWALVEQGRVADGLSQIREAIATAWATGAGVGRSPWLLATLAEACGQAGQSAEGLCVLEEARERVQAKEEHLYEPEVYRLKGELLLQQSTAQQGEAEEHLQQALALARHQQAKSLELRAAMSLARLWQRQGKRVEAHELLAPIYGWFTEGFGTADLQEARVRLKELGE